MSARRSGRRPSRRRRSAQALALSAVACLVLGATFAAGALGARWWSRHGEPSATHRVGPRSTGELRAAEVALPAPSTLSWKAWLGFSPRKRTPEVSARGDGPAKPPPPPVLTFYQELTAPLSAPAPTARPTPGTPSHAPRPSAPPRPVSAGPVPGLPAPAFAPRPETSGDARRDPSIAPDPETARERRGGGTAGAPSGPRFTIQVGSYRVRETADAVRARLVGSGQDVYVTESEGPEGARYRVRVGSFVSHDAARMAAAKLAAERQVPTFVTTR